MTDQETTDRATTNGRLATNNRLKGRKKQWKDLSVDPLAEGFDSHQAEYVVGKSPVTWSTLEPGHLFARSKSGKSLYVKINDGRVDEMTDSEVIAGIQRHYDGGIVAFKLATEQ